MSKIVKNSTVLVILLLCSFYNYGQKEIVLKGTISDSNSGNSIPYASISLYKSDSIFIKGTSSDSSGNYIINGIKELGTYQIRCNIIGFKDTILEIQIFGSIILNISLNPQETILNELKITSNEKGEVTNDFSVVSSNSFSIEEIKKYPGSRNDPARMVSNYAGIGGSDDSRNDIVIRGNSPMGVVYRFQGVDIPNPNHFSIPGTSGGPVSIINEKYLKTSDFFTSAFPAEYGNALAGVFDLYMRDGNNQKHKNIFQIGVLGLEGLTEGPINKNKKSNYIITGRYSTLDLVKKLGINFGTTSNPSYYDMGFKFSFSFKKAKLEFYGIAGGSKNIIKVSEEVKPSSNLYTDYERDQEFKTNMIVLGLSYSKNLTNRTNYKLNHSYSSDQQLSYHENVFRTFDSKKFIFNVDSIKDKLYYHFSKRNIAINNQFKTVFNHKNILQYGLNFDMSEQYFSDSLFNDLNQTWKIRLNSTINTYMVRPYVNYKAKINSSVTLMVGFHNQYYSLNKNFSIFEPRIGLKYILSENESIAIGLSRHSQAQPTYVTQVIKYNSDNISTLPNENIGFSYSNHFVVNYTRNFNKNFRLKSEIYYQYLTDIPVEEKKSSFSMINQGIGFDRFFPDSLVNEGTAFNYGIEITLERFFRNNYFFMLNGSLFESKYRGSDKVLRDTDFNGNWIFNLVGGYHFKLNQKSKLGIAIKVTCSGGKKYTPIDVESSNNIGDIVFIDELKNSTSLPDYFRTDLKFNWLLRGKKINHEIGLDLINLTNHQNIYQFTYSSTAKYTGTEPIVPEYQLGFLPIFYYKIDF